MQETIIICNISHCPNTIFINSVTEEELKVLLRA